VHTLRRLGSIHTSGSLGAEGLTRLTWLSHWKQAGVLRLRHLIPCTPSSQCLQAERKGNNRNHDSPHTYLLVSLSMRWRDRRQRQPLDFHGEETTISSTAQEIHFRSMQLKTSPQAELNLKNWIAFFNIFQSWKFSKQAPIRQGEYNPWTEKYRG
jgi:hypothetical protein